MEYPKIETLYERDDKSHKIKEELILKNPVYALIKSWQWTEKIDGMNMRIIWEGAVEKLSFNGRTDKAQIPGDLVKYMYDLVTPEGLKAVFQGSNVVLYGEGYGVGIQKGGGLYSPTKKFILFDVLVEGRYWLNWAAVQDIGDRLKIDLVPYVGNLELQDAASLVRDGFNSRLGEHPPAEGMVGRTAEPLFDNQGKRLIVKLKTKDFWPVPLEERYVNRP
jgi:hypothetical protein